MKKIVYIITALFVSYIANAAEKKSIPVGFREVELIATIEAIVVVKPETNLQYWRVRLDGRQNFFYVFTDEKGKVGDRIVVLVVSRVGGLTEGAWMKVRPLNP